MASFAILRHEGADDFEILHCHLNFWRLPGIPRECIFFDVGLHILATRDMTTFKVVLPFVAESIRDLRQALADPETALLIFRRPSKDNSVSFGNADSIPLVPLNIAKCQRRLKDGPDHSVWEIAIDPLAAGTEGVYVSRLLEGDAWQTYLGRRTRNKRLSIFGWEYPAPAQVGAAAQGPAQLPINRSNPYRVFVDLSRDVMELSLWAAIQNTIVIGFLLGVLGALAWPLWNAGFVAAAISSSTKAGIIGVVVVVLSFLAHYSGSLEKAYSQVSRFTRWIDKVRYSVS